MFVVININSTVKVSGKRVRDYMATLRGSNLLVTIVQFYKYYLFEKKKNITHQKSLTLLWRSNLSNNDPDFLIRICNSINP